MVVEFWRELQALEQGVALETLETKVSYNELKERAVTASPGLAGLVSLHFPKSIDYVVALLACWSKGAAFVPVDPHLPGARQEAILRAARPDQRWCHGSPPQATGHCNWDPGEVAYVICTSGSSGQPKAVEVGHGGLVPMLRDQIAAFRLGPGKRSLWLLSTQFDASLSDLGAALLSGATLCLPPPGAALELPYWLERLRITHVDLPPALLRRYRPEDFPACVETLIVGGEPSPPEVLRRWSQRFHLVSVYGPTEATICTHLRQVDQTWDAPYLGDPIGAMSHRVVDGELWLSGSGLARGYRDGNNSSFVVDDGVRYYRTGDRVDPLLVFLGRLDRQVKVRGHRVELDEVESHLMQQGVTRAAVLSQGERLVAFYEGDCEPSVSETLPSWMRPVMHRLERLPLTASDKVDRATLQALAQTIEAPLDSLGCLQRAAELQAHGITMTPFDLLGGSPHAMSCEILLQLAPPPRFPPLPGVPVGRRVLLTGAHGQLGRRLLARLLPDHQVFAVVRRPLEPHPNLVEIRADLEDDWTAPEVDSIFHCAAVVNSVLPFERLRGVNLDLLERLVGLGKPLHCASTLSVFVSSDFRGRATVEQTGCGKIYGGYAQSKWLAEQWLAGLDGVWMYRYGLLVDYAEDALHSFLRGLISLGAYPRGPEIRIDTTPIDWAAEMTLDLARTSPPGTYHLASRGEVTLEALICSLESKGYRLRAVPPAEFFSLPIRSAEEGAAQLGLCRLHPDPAFFQANRASDLFQATDVEFELSRDPLSFDLTTLGLCSAP